MPYMKTTLISRPIEPAFAGISQALGLNFSDITGAVKSIGENALNIYGQGMKVQGAQEAAAQQVAQQPAAGGGSSGGISTTMLVVGGLALAGALVFVMRRK